MDINDFTNTLDLFNSAPAIVNLPDLLFVDALENKYHIKDIYQNLFQFKAGRSYDLVNGVPIGWNHQLYLTTIGKANFTNILKVSMVSTKYIDSNGKISIIDFNADYARMASHLLCDVDNNFSDLVFNKMSGLEYMYHLKYFS